MRNEIFSSIWVSYHLPRPVRYGNTDCGNVWQRASRQRRREQVSVSPVSSRYLARRVRPLNFVTYPWQGRRIHVSTGPGQIGVKRCVSCEYTVCERLLMQSTGTRIIDSPPHTALSLKSLSVLPVSQPPSPSLSPFSRSLLLRSESSLYLIIIVVNKTTHYLSKHRQCPGLWTNSLAQHVWCGKRTSHRCAAGRDGNKSNGKDVVFDFSWRPYSYPSKCFSCKHFSLHVFASMSDSVGNLKNKKKH